MSEKIYACLLRLYPSAFRSKYREEALQLYRDRLRDEPGMFSRCRLNFDLLIDALTGLRQAWGNSYTTADAPSLMPTTDGVPTFRFLDRQPLQPVSILIGSTLSLAALSAIGLMMSLPKPELIELAYIHMRVNPSDRCAGDMNPLPPVERAIQDQLRLKLEPAKSPIPILVVDHVEMPPQN